MGIYGCTLFETLHAINHGLIRYHVEALHNIIEEKTVGKAEKALYNQYFRTIITYLARQSEQEFPRGSSRSPYTNNTYMTAGEHRGNQVVFIISLYTKDVKLLLSRVLDKYHKKKGGRIGSTVGGCREAIK